MGIISCSFYKSYFFFLGFWISELIRSLDNYFLKKIEKEKEQKQKDMFDLICLNLSDILAIFLVIYTFITSKEHKIKYELKNFSNSNKTKLIYQDLSYPKFNKLYLLLISSILDFIARSVFFTFSFSMNKEPLINNQQIDWLVSLDISFRAIFSRLILKTKLYNHHFISIIICLIGFSFMTISDLFYVIEINWKNLYYLLFIFPKYILFPLSDVFNEIIFTVNYIQPQTLMFLRGLCQFIILDILCLILFITKSLSFNIFISNDKLKLFKQIILRLFYTLFSCFRTFCLNKVLYLYNNQHISFLVIVFTFNNFIIGLITNESKSIGFNISLYNTIQIVSLIIIFFGTLVYNEIIIINICGMNEYTKKGLLFKEKIDIEQIKSGLIENSNEKEDNEN